MIFSISALAFQRFSSSVDSSLVLALQCCQLVYVGCVQSYPLFHFFTSWLMGFWLVLLQRLALEIFWCSGCVIGICWRKSDDGPGHPSCLRSTQEDCLQADVKDSLVSEGHDGSQGVGCTSCLADSVLDVIICTIIFDLLPN